MIPERAEGGYLQRWAAVVDRRHDEVDKGGEARGHPDECAQAVGASSGIAMTAKPSAKPEQRRGPVEVGEGVGGDALSEHACVGGSGFR